MERILLVILAISSLTATAQTGLMTADCGNIQKVRYSPNILNRLIVSLTNVESLTYMGGVLQTSESNEKVRIKIKGSNELQMVNMMSLNTAAQGAKLLNGYLCTTEKFYGSDFIHILGVGRTKKEALKMLLESYETSNHQLKSRLDTLGFDDTNKADYE